MSKKRPYCRCGHPAIGHGPGGCSGMTLRGAVWHPCKCEGQGAFVHDPKRGPSPKVCFEQIFRDFEFGPVKA